MRVTVIGVPSAWGAPDPGVTETPARLRAAGLLDWLAGAGLEVRDHGDVPVLRGWQAPATFSAPVSDGGQLPHLCELLAVQREVRQAVGRTLEAGELPLLIGGECGIAPGAMAAVAASTTCAPVGGTPARPVIVWLDAHGDLNTPETSPSGLLCGMPLSVALGRGHPESLAVGADTPTPSPEDTWLIGARDLDAGELATLAELPIHQVTVDELRGLGAEQLIERILPGAAILPPEARVLSPQASEVDRCRLHRPERSSRGDVSCRRWPGHRGGRGSGRLLVRQRPFGRPHHRLSEPVGGRRGPNAEQLADAADFDL